VSLEVSESSDGDHVASSDEGNDKMVVVPAGMKSVAFTVSTVGDSTDEPNSLVTLSVIDGSGYSLGDASSASVRVHDDDDDGSTREIVFENLDGTPFRSGIIKKSESFTLRMRLVSGTGPVTVSLPSTGLSGLGVPGTDYEVNSPVTIPAGESETLVTLKPLLSSPQTASFAIALMPQAPDGFSVNPTTLNFVVRIDQVLVQMFRLDTKPEEEVLLERSAAAAKYRQAEIEVSLFGGRTLKAGERIDVPLLISGNGITRQDFSLSLKPGDTLNTGVMLESPDSLVLEWALRFEGAGAKTAVLIFEASADGVAEDYETAKLALGSREQFRTAPNTNVSEEDGVAPLESASSVSLGIVSSEDTPTVTVRPTQPVVTVGTSAQFTVSVNPTQPYPVTVLYSHNASNYVSTEAVVDLPFTVPANAASATLGISTSNPDSKSASEQLTVSLGGGAYLLGSPSSATVTLVPPGVTVDVGDGLSVVESGSDTDSFTVVLDALVVCPEADG